MTWFSPKPSLTDRLLMALTEERRLSAEMQKAHLSALETMMTSAAAQSAVTREWLSMLSNSAQSQVRIMTDLDEFAHDQARLAAAPQPPQEPAGTIDPAKWMADLSHDFARLKQDLL
jgi:hypothetical protein